MLLSTWIFFLTIATIVVSLVTGISVFGALYFPYWFRILFLIGTTIFCLLLVFNWLLYRRPALLRKFEFSFNGDKGVVWILVWFSFVAVASLHQFSIFNPGRLVHDLHNNGGKFLFNINTLFNLLGLIAVPAIYFLRNRLNWPIALLAIATTLLIPNDACINPFNGIWLSHGVLSPMMFVPNVGVILFSIPLLMNRLNMVSFAVIVTSTICTLVLGFGHITHFLW